MRVISNTRHDLVDLSPAICQYAINYSSENVGEGSSFIIITLEEYFQKFKDQKQVLQFKEIEEMQELW